MHLAGKGIAWATLNRIVCALRFFCSVTLGQGEVPERIAYARKPAALPDVLNIGMTVVLHRRALRRSGARSAARSARSSRFFIAIPVRI